MLLGSARQTVVFASLSSNTMYDIIDLLTGEMVDGGFDSYAYAVRYFEAEGYNYEMYAIVGPDDAEEEE